MTLIITTIIEKSNYFMKIGKIEIEIENENSTLNSCLLIGVFELNFNDK